MNSIYKYIPALLIIGCTHRSPQQRLAGFINDPENRIMQSLQIGEVKATAKWLPYAYRNTATKNNSIPAHEDYCYFNVRFERTAIDKPTHEKRMYLDFDMQNDFTLLCAGDSIAAGICQKIENGRQGSYEYLLAFDNSSKAMDKNDFTLLYKDKVFGIGVLAFVYRQKDLRKISRL